MKNAYKKFNLLTLAILVSGNSFAVNHLIEVEDFEFNPRNLIVSVGDTVTWFWHDGFHTTTSELVPAGAASWDSPISSNSPSFSYVVSQPGTYTYFCQPHQSMGMTGSFTASGTTGIEDSSSPKPRFFVYQDADDRSLLVRFESAINHPGTFRVMDLSGRSIYTSALIQPAKGEMIRIHLTDLSEGIYLAEFGSELTREVRRIILR
jgi:plastocyanin